MMRKCISSIIFLCCLVIAGCANQGDELEEFVKAYNNAVDTLEKNTDFEIDKLYPEKFKKIKKQDDGFGYYQILDEGKDESTTALYRVECLYDNNKNIIGYQSYGIGKLQNMYDDGSVDFSDKGISTGYIIAKALDLDIDTFDKHYQKLMDTADDEGENEVSYEEKNYKITMNSDIDIGAISFKFMKTK
jgi:hypothetical protein